MKANESILLKKTKTWTTVNIVLLIIGTVISIFSMISLMSMRASGYAMFRGLPGGEEMIDLLEQSISPVSIAITVILIAVNIALVVWFFKCNGRMKQNIVPEKLPYYINVGLFLLNQIYSLVSGGTQNNVSSGIIITVVLALVFLWIRIMPLVHLRRITTKPGEQIQEIE